MTASEVLVLANLDGVRLSLDGTNAIRIHGERSAVQRWTSTIRDQKQALIFLLEEWARLEAAIHAYCDALSDGPEHRAALLKECANESPTEWPWYTRYFLREAGRMTTVRAAKEID